MKSTRLFALMALAVIFLSLLDLSLAGKKKKSKSKKKDLSNDFSSKNLQCLVCKALVYEFNAEIYKIDPKKMIDTGTFRVDDKGEQKRSVVSTYFLNKMSQKFLSTPLA